MGSQNNPPAENKQPFRKTRIASEKSPGIDTSNTDITSDKMYLLAYQLLRQNSRQNGSEVGQTNASAKAQKNADQIVQNGHLLVIDPWATEQAKTQSDGLDDKPNADKPKDQPYVERTEPTKEELDFLRRSLPISAELQQQLIKVTAAIENEHRALWKNVKELVNKTGRDPQDVLVEAMKKSRVVGIGETHTFDNDSNALTAFGINRMKNLQELGKGTDFTVELPKVLQPVLDKFNDDPKKGALAIPDKIIEKDGKENTTEEATGGLKFLKQLKERSPDFMKLLAAARDAGMPIHCVDNNYTALRFANPGHPSLPKLLEQQNADIKNNIMDIVDKSIKPGDPEIRVIAWLGGLHFPDGKGEEKQRSAGELLREELAKRHETITTFMGQIGRAQAGNTLYALTSQINRPVSVATHDSEGKPNELGKIPLFRTKQEGFPDYELSAFDHVLVFPREAPVFQGNPKVQIIIDGLKNIKPGSNPKPEKYLPETASELELRRFGTQENVIKVKKEINTEGKPFSEILSDAMKNSRVLGIGLDSYEKGHEQFSLTAMKSLKDAGATHVVVPFKQDVLDEFMKAGKVDSTKVNSFLGNAMTLISMQAALQNGLKLVSSTPTKPGPSEQYKAKLAAVESTLKDKNAKVILLTHNNELASVEDWDGQAVTAQLIRKAVDPANPSERIKFTSVYQADLNNPGSPFSTLFEELRQPLGLQLRQAQSISKVKIGTSLDYKDEPTVDSWDILMAWPNQR